VRLDGQTRTVSRPRTATPLDVGIDEGIDAPFSCREGHCGACALLKHGGEIEMDTNDVVEPDDLADGLILACQARPRPMWSK